MAVSRSSNQETDLLEIIENKIKQLLGFEGSLKIFSFEKMHSIIFPSVLPENTIIRYVYILRENGLPSGIDSSTIKDNKAESNRIIIFGQIEEIYSKLISSSVNFTPGGPDDGALNGTQKSIIQSTFEFIFLPFGELPPVNAIKALKAISDDEMTQHVAYFMKKGVLASIAQGRKILRHTCPENRAQSYPYVEQEKDFSMYRLEKERVKELLPDGTILLKNGRIIPKEYVVRNKPQDSFIIAKEPAGLLGLTAREDDSTAPVTKRTVANYIYQLISDEILKNQNLAAKKIQAFFRNRKFLIFALTNFQKKFSLMISSLSDMLKNNNFIDYLNEIAAILEKFPKYALYHCIAYFKMNQDDYEAFHCLFTFYFFKKNEHIISTFMANRDFSQIYADISQYINIGIITYENNINLLDCFRIKTISFDSSASPHAYGGFSVSRLNDILNEYNIDKIFLVYELMHPETRKITCDGLNGTSKALKCMPINILDKIVNSLKRIFEIAEVEYEFEHTPYKSNMGTPGTVIKFGFNTKDAEKTIMAMESIGFKEIPNEGIILGIKEGLVLLNGHSNRSVMKTL